MTNVQLQKETLTAALGSLYLRMLRAEGDKYDQLHAEVSGYKTALRAGFGEPFSAEVFNAAWKWARTQLAADAAEVEAADDQRHDDGGYDDWVGRMGGEGQ